jgi:hypothetical protein
MHPFKIYLPVICADVLQMGKRIVTIYSRLYTTTLKLIFYIVVGKTRSSLR